MPEGNDRSGTAGFEGPEQEDWKLAMLATESRRLEFERNLEQAAQAPLSERADRLRAVILDDQRTQAEIVLETQSSLDGTRSPDPNEMETKRMDDPERGDLSREFARAKMREAVTFEPGELSREFNYAAAPPIPPQNSPEHELDQEPTGGGGPTLGPVSGAMSIDEQRASRLEEVRGSLNEQFRHAAKERAKEPELGR